MSVVIGLGESPIFSISAVMSEISFRRVQLLLEGRFRGCELGFFGVETDFASYVLVVDSSLFGKRNMAIAWPTPNYTALLIRIERNIKSQ